MELADCPRRRAAEGHLRWLFLAVHAALVATCTSIAVSSAYGQQRFANGLFVSQPEGPVQLTIYAETRQGGQLRLQTGSLNDVPMLTPWTNLRILASMPLWTPVAVLIATEEIFYKQEPETRRLSIAARKFNVYTVEVRASDLENAESVVRLFRSVKATPEAPGYAFIVLHSQGMTRYYPIRLKVDE